MKPTITVNDGEIYVGAAVPAHDLSEEAMTTPTPNERLVAWLRVMSEGPGRAESKKEKHRRAADLIERLQRDLAAAQSELASWKKEAEDARALSMDLAAAQEALVQERRYTRSLVSDPLPESPLRSLGEWLADHLDDDRWKNCEANFLIPAIAFLKEAQEARQRAEEAGASMARTTAELLIEANNRAQRAEALAESYRKDAERYRFLRDYPMRRDLQNGDTWWNVSVAQGGTGRVFRADALDDALDAAIDAAIAGEKP